MARLEDMGTTGVRATQLRPEIVIMDWSKNYRTKDTQKTLDHIAWLKESIKAEGVEQAIKVQFIAGKVYLVDGQCRVEACKQLFKEGVKVPYKSGGFGPPLVPALAVAGDEADMLAASMVANGSVPPTKIELGAAADRLLKLGWPKEKVALYVPSHLSVKGFRAARYVEEAVELHHAPISVKKAVQEGKDGVRLSEPAALKIARENPLDPEPAIDAEVARAKAAGKTEAKRPKGAGAATKAKEADEEQRRPLEKIGDEMADEIVSVPFDLEKLERLAAEWHKTRGR